MTVQLGYLSNTARYALAAATELARLGDGERLTSADLAKRTGVPRAFLGKLLARLAHEGVVDGLKGHGGGYRLARPAGAILLEEVLAAVNEGGRPVCALGVGRCDPDDPCALHHRWSKATSPIKQLFATVTLGELVA